MSSQMEFEDAIIIAQIAHPLLLSIVASVTTLFYDTILTFDEEVKYIWGSKFSAPKVLYFAIRYLALFLQCMTCIAIFGFDIPSSPNLCNVYVWLQGIVGILILSSAKALFIYRSYAFDGRGSRLILWSLIILVALHITAVLVLIVISLLDYQVFSNPFPSPLSQISGHCIILGYPGLVTYIWFTELLGQCILFVFIVYIILRTQLCSWKQGWALSPLYIAFIRDKLWTYAAVLVNVLLCAIYTHSLSAKGLAFTVWIVSTGSICGTRLVLNLHASADFQKDVSVETNGIIEFRTNGSGSSASANERI